MDKETGIGSWTDGEIARSIREGVSRNGESLFHPKGEGFEFTVSPFV